MEFSEVVRLRRTTNGPFADRTVSARDQRTLVEVAGMAPSHFNSQPWRFVLIDDRARIEQIAEWSGESMTTVFREGRFFNRYRRHFRFSRSEMDEHRSGILFDKMPAVLKPFTKYVFSERATALMNRLKVPETLGRDNAELVGGAPLVLAVLLDRTEYIPGELSGFYSVFGMGAAIENIWLTTVELGMGIQFISFPMEVPETWQKIVDHLAVPDDLELMAMYRLGYLPDDEQRPTIDWSSRERRRISQYVFRNTCSEPEPDDVQDPST